VVDLYRAARDICLAVLNKKKISKEIIKGAIVAKINTEKINDIKTSETTKGGPVKLSLKEWNQIDPTPNPGDIVLLDPSLFVNKHGNLFEDRAQLNDLLRSENIDHSWAKELGRKIREEGQKVEATVVFVNGKPKLIKGAHRTVGCWYEGYKLEARVLDPSLVPSDWDQVDLGMIDNFDTQEKKVSTIKEEENWVIAKLKEDPEIWKKTGIDRTPSEPTKEGHDRDAAKLLEYIKSLCDPETGENKGQYTKLTVAKLKGIITEHRVNEALLTKGLYAPQNPEVESRLPKMMQKVGVTLDEGTWSGQIKGNGSSIGDPDYRGYIMHRVGFGRGGGGTGHLNSYMLSREKFPKATIFILGILKNPSSLVDLIMKRYKLLEAFEQKQDAYRINGKKPYDNIYFIPQRRSGNFLNTDIPGIKEEPSDQLVTADEVRQSYQVLQSRDKKATKKKPPKKTK